MSDIDIAIDALKQMTGKDWPLLLSPGLRQELEAQLKGLRKRRNDGFDLPRMP